MANKTVDNKKRIIILIRNRDIKAAFKLFNKSYTQENPADLEFVKNIFVEINRLSAHKENFEFLASIGYCYPDNLEFQEIFETATKIYVDNLILQANNIQFERLEKLKNLEDSIKKANPLVRDKMRADKTLQLENLNKKAKDLYKLAYSYDSKNLMALKGWQECCQIADEKEEAQQVQDKITELKPSLRDKSVILKVAKEKTGSETATNFAYNDVHLDNDTYEELLALFDEKKYQLLIDKIEKLSTSLVIPAKILILKGKALVELRRFKDADLALFEAENTNTDYLDVKQAKEEVSECKYKLYVKAGSTFLQKGIHLGSSLGSNNFKKAKECFIKALEINPDNIDLLDQYYSTLKYLGEHEEAFKIKGAIYSLEPRYTTSYDSNYNHTLCFIATYAYYDQPWIIDEFRWFRREYLLTNNLGRRINSLYVCLSSKITKSVQNKEFIRQCVKLLLYIPLALVELLKYIKSGNINE